MPSNEGTLETSQVRPREERASEIAEAIYVGGNVGIVRVDDKDGKVVAAPFLAMNALLDRANYFDWGVIEAEKLAELKDCLNRKKLPLVVAMNVIFDGSRFGIDDFPDMDVDNFPTVLCPFYGPSLAGKSTLCAILGWRGESCFEFNWKSVCGVDNYIDEFKRLKFAPDASVEMLTIAAGLNMKRSTHGIGLREWH